MEDQSKWKWRRIGEGMDGGVEVFVQSGRWCAVVWSGVDEGWVYKRGDGCRKMALLFRRERPK